MNLRVLVRVAEVSAVLVLVALLGINGPRIWDEVQLRTGAGLPERSLPAMEIVAHRGDLDLYPEDTLEAIVAATETGADGIEFDVHRSADGTWWVTHDPTLDEDTTGAGHISQLSDAEIASAVVDGGFGFDPQRHVGLRIATLQSVLHALQAWNGDLYIDLQHAETGQVSEIILLLAGRPATILCRSAADAASVAGEPDVHAISRRTLLNAVPYLNGWLVDAHGEVTPDRVAASDLPYVTFVDERDYATDEGPLLRRAWASNVSAFLTKHLGEALRVRGELSTR